MIQLQMLNRILIDKSLNIVLNNGLTIEHFNQYKQEYSFIINHYQEYGNIPDDETILGKFPQLELIEVHETERYLVQGIQEQLLYNKMVPVLQKTAELLQTDAKDAVSYILPQVQELIKTHTYSAGTDIMSNTTQRYTEMIERKSGNGLLGISSGLEELDEILGGWISGEELVSIVGRPNQGKSWILLYFLAMAWKQGKKVLVYSGEMGTNDVGYRVDTLLSHISNIQITRGTLSNREEERYKEHLDKSEKRETPFIVVTPTDLGNKRMTVPMLQSLIEKYNPDIVGIDQISLMDDARSNRDQLRIQIAHITEDLFRTSEKYKIPVLADAQASRGAAGNEEAPELEHLAESDSIGQFSSRVITIVQAPSGLKLAVKKNRKGANNITLTYNWDIDRGTFEYLPTNEVDNHTSEETVQLRARNRRSTNEQREQFNDGSEVF